MATNAGTVTLTPDYTDDPLPWEPQQQQQQPQPGLTPYAAAHPDALTSMIGPRPPNAPVPVTQHLAARRNAMAQPGLTTEMRAASPANVAVETGLKYGGPALAAVGTGLGIIDAAGGLVPALPTMARGMAGQQTGRWIGGKLGSLAGPWGRMAGEMIGGWVGGGLGGGGAEPGTQPTEAEQAESLRPPQGSALGQLPVPQQPAAPPAEQESIVPQQFPRGVPAQAGAGTGSAGAGAVPRAEAAQSGPGLKVPGAVEQQQPLGTIQTPSARPRLTASDVALIDKFRRGEEMSTEEQLTLSNRLMQLLGREKAQQMWSEYLSNVKRMGGAQTK